MMYGGIKVNYCFLCNDFFAQYKSKEDIKTSIKNTKKKD